MGKISKSNRDLDLDRTMPNVEKLIRGYSYPTIYSNFKILDHLFFELSCLQTHTHRQTDTRRRVLYTSGLNRKYSKPSLDLQETS